MTEQHDLGLSHDLPLLISRRRALGLIAGGLGATALAACGGDSGGGTTQKKTSGAEIPEETAGPYPGDGSNGPNALAESGVVRSDIRSSFGEASGRAEGVLTTVALTLSVTGAAVYLWHCNREGQYSMYDEAVADQNYLRGVQVSDKQGKVEFTSIFPAAYSGRWPHMHFEVYESVDAATAGGTKLRTSQLAIPKDVCDAVYATDGYEQSVQNLAQTSLDADMVFSDGYSSQLARWSGSPEDGIALKLDVRV
jgi:protocatechuate 3,4-dioxygenase beta subunit